MIAFRTKKSQRTKERRNEYLFLWPSCKNCMLPNNFWLGFPSEIQCNQRIVEDPANSRFLHDYHTIVTTSGRLYSTDAWGCSHDMIRGPICRNMLYGNARTSEGNFGRNPKLGRAIRKLYYSQEYKRALCLNSTSKYFSML